MRLALLFLVAAVLAGCSSMAENPVGIGNDLHELKQSPCACLEIPMNIPEHLKV